MGSKIKIPLRNGKFLVCDFQSWSDEFPDEICTWIEDKEGVMLQNIAIIREHEKEDKVQVLVYADCNNEDYTHKFDIEHYNFEEEE